MPRRRIEYGGLAEPRYLRRVTPRRRRRREPTAVELGRAAAICLVLAGAVALAWWL